MRHVVALFVLAGCASESEIVQDLPSWPESKAPGVPSQQWTDRLVQLTVPQVDVLWTVDNSSSMGNEQSALAENFPLFGDFFVGSGLDYHIGVTTTDIVDPMRDGSLHEVDGYRYIDNDTPDPIGVFAAMALVGTNGQGEECGLGGTYHALEDKVDTVNAGFYRAGADLHTIVITDEEDQTPEAVITPPEFLGWYAGLKTEEEELTFSSIVSFEDLAPADRGETYLQMTEEVGGISWDIADEDWTLVLEELGIQAAGFKTEFFLSHRPVSDSITVIEERTDGIVIPHERPAWTWDQSRNSVTFQTYVPEALATIVITYTLLASE
jgi:hypothetical protein